MSDLVERLRNEHQASATKARIMCREAATRIEELEAAAKKVINAHNDWESGMIESVGRGFDDPLSDAVASLKLSLSGG